MAVDMPGIFLLGLEVLLGFFTIAMTSPKEMGSSTTARSGMDQLMENIMTKTPIGACKTGKSPGSCYGSCSVSVYRYRL